MTVQDMNLGARFFASSQEIFCEREIRIEVGSDFDAYGKIVSEGRPIQGLGAPFDPERHQLDDHNSFWLAAYDKAGDLIHTQAAKRLDMSGASLDNYMRHHFREFPPALPDIDLIRSRFRASPGAHMISGNVVYHGDVWIAPEKGNYRGVGLSTVLARYGLLLAMGRWDPDFIFGFMAQAVAFKGFAERMGYMHNEPGALRWYREGNDKALEGFLSYLSNSEIRYLFEMPVRELVAKAA